MILCIGTTPAAQRVMVFRKLEMDAVNRAANTWDGAAGKSINVAKVLATLGERPIAIGFAGGERGRKLLEILALKEIETEFVTVAAPTRQCISVLDESAQTVTELVEESQPVKPEDYAALRVIVRKRLPSCAAVVMSGSLTPGGPVDLYREITLQAKVAGILSVVDAQGLPLVEALAAQPGLVKPNRQELAATVQRSLGSDLEIIAAMREVSKRGAVRVVVTSGKAATLALQNEQVWRIQPPSISAVNPIGSGDAFTAALVWRLVQKENLGEACRWAAAAGAANALSAMPGELDRGDVERLVRKVKIEKL
jgi:1-phosphofructokinase family hexose kinase